MQQSFLSDIQLHVCQVTVAFIGLAIKLNCNKPRGDRGKMLVPKSDDAITSATMLLFKINTDVTKS